MFGHNSITGRSHFKDAGNKLLVTSRFMTLQGEGPYRGEPAFFVRLAMCNLDCSFCFLNYKEIMTANRGRVRMDQLVEGDELYTLDDNMQLTTTKVINTMSRRVKRKELRKLSYQDETGGPVRSIIATKEHPFHVRGKGFVPMEELAEGDIIFNSPRNAMMAHRMKHHNPMRNEAYVQKMADTTRQRYEEGTLVPYKRSKKWRRDCSKRMTEDNPMHKEGAAKKMLQTKVYPKSGLEEKAEAIFAKMCDIRFVGDDPKFVIGDEEHGFMRPDFIIEGTKKVIEVYDPTFALYKRGTPEEQAIYETSRREHYARFGYKVEFFKAQEFDWRTKPGSGYKAEIDPVKRKAFKKKLGTFENNGVRVVEVSKLDKRQYARVRFTSSPEGRTYVTNVSCHPYNHFLIDGLHVHNCDTFFDSGDWIDLDHLIDRVIPDQIEDYYKGETPEWAQHLQGYQVYSEEDVPEGRDHVCFSDDQIWVQTRQRQMGLVVTGGEPTLQLNLIKFCQRALEQFKWVQIETNGTQEIDHLPRAVTVVCSPKCLEKDGKAIRYLQPRQSVLDRADCLKFVMCADPDSPYSEVPEWAHEWRKRTGHPVFVSPMNIYNEEPQKSKDLRARNQGEITIEERSTIDEVVSFWTPGLLDMVANQRNHEFAAKYCVQNGFVFNVQIHLLASLA